MPEPLKDATRSDEQKLAAAIGRLREIGRFQDGDDREPIVVYTSHGDTGLRYIIAQENEESLVLTTRELRWLVNVMFGDATRIPAWRFWRANLVWKLSEWCPHWWKTLEPQVKRCRLCRCIQFDAATMEQLQRWLSDG